MKKHRKQRVNVFGEKLLADVPIDDELYKADNHAEYQRARSKNKDVPLNYDILADTIADAITDYEEKQLIVCLYKALQDLSEDERQLIEYIYFDGLSEQETADLLHVAQQTVNKRKHKSIQKLRDKLVDWI